MKSCKHIRRSAVASLLVLSACLGASQAYATDVDPNTGSATRGTLDISGKTVTVDDGQSYGYIRGSYVSITGNDGTAIAGGNTVSVSNNTSTTSAVQGGKAMLSVGGSAISSDNTVTVSGGSHNSVRGGLASLTTGGTGTASDNTVTLSGVTITGGWTGAGEASTLDTATGNATLSATNNKMTMDGGSAGTMSAGFCFNYANGSANASDNDLILKNKANVTTTVVAGHAYAKNGNTTANNNTLTSTEGAGGIYNDTVNGGRARTDNGSATAQENSGTLTGVTVGGDFMGGLAQGTTGANAYKNEFTLDGGSYAQKVQGGRAETTGGEASATWNKLIFNNNTTFESTINAGSSETTGTKATTTNNTLEALSGVTLKARIRVGEALSTGTAYANSNTANLKGGTSSSWVVGGYGYLSGDTATYTEANENVVTVENFANVKGVYGGEVQIAGSGNGLVEHNTGTLTNVAACSKLAGGTVYNQSGTVTATRNEFTILNGKYTNIYGGLAEVKTGKDGVQDVAKATSNIIDMTEGSIIGDAFGGRADIQKGTTGSDTAEVSSNILNLNGTNAEKAGMLLGGYATVSGTGIAKATGNKGSWTNVKYAKDGGTNLAGGGLASVKSGSATATDNIFSLTGGSYSIFAGGKAQVTAGTNVSTDTATVSGNQATLKDGASTREFTGGIATISGTGTAKVQDNEVELTNATSEAGIITGATASAEGGVSDANKNTVTISGGTYYNVNGGQSITGTGTAESVSNEASVADAVSAGFVTGGSSAVVKGTALAQKNKAILSGGTYTNLFGGHAGVLSSYVAAADIAEKINASAGQAAESAILLTSLDEDAALLTDGDASVAVADETAAEAAEGSATVTGNELVVTNASVSGAAAGGYGTIEGTSGSVKVFANSLRMVKSGDGTISSTGSVNGGLAVAENGTVEVYENSFELDAGTYNDINGGNAVVLGEGTATASGQVHELNYTAAVQYSGSLVAGKASVGSGQAVATENKLTLQGTYTGNVVASQAMVTDASSSSDKASATKSSITVNDAVINGELHGGFAYVNGSGSAEVSDIEVILNGGQYDSSVSAGYILAMDASVAATAVNNTLVLRPGSDGTSSPVFNAQETVLYGGYATTDETTSIHATASNNTLRFEHVKGMTAANIKGFTNYEFNLPGIRAEETVLTLTGGADGETTSVANTTIKATVGNVYSETGGKLQIGDRICLLKNNNGLDSTRVRNCSKITIEF